jgi:DNA-binding IclR family transcriptional regulator
MRKVGPDSGAEGTEGGGVRAVERALTIIRVLAEERRPLGISEIVASTALPQGTVHRLLATLIDQGWVEHGRFTSRYRLGPGILGTTAIALAHAPLLDAGRPILTNLAGLCGLDAYLSVLVGRRVVFLERAAAPGKRYSDFHTGITQPAHCTAGGKALLASLPELELQRFLHDQRPLRRYTPATVTDPAMLAHELKLVREHGYAQDVGEFNGNWRSVAVPVRGSERGVIAAMSCGGSAARMTDEKMRIVRAELPMVADDLSSRLAGYES